MPQDRQRPPAAVADVMPGARARARSGPGAGEVVASRADAGERVLDAAVDLIRARGLAVALDRIGLEEAIAASGVARATAYRRWSSREAFQQQVLLRVAADARLDLDSGRDVAALRVLLAGRRDLLRTPQGRRTLVVEALRLATGRDVRRLVRSRTWRDHLALRATAAGLPVGALRDTVTAALATTERELAEQRAAVYAALADALGYRLVPWLPGGTGYLLMAEATGAMMTGLVARAAVVDPARTLPAPSSDAGSGAEPDAAPGATPGAARVPASVRVAAFGSQVVAPWTTEVHALVATVLAHVEPDPAVRWDDARIAAVLAAPAVPGPESRG